MSNRAQCLLFAAGVGVAGSSAAPNGLRWDALPPLPPAAGQTVQPGVASPFAGVHNGALIIAGGANFPGKMPWEGGAKVWWDDVWVLEKTSGGATRWVGDSTFKLPRRIGYGISVSTPDGVICIGGNDAERCYADVFLLSWEPRTRGVRTARLPSLPQPLANMAGALVGNTIFVSGGQHVVKGATPSSAFWALDLARRDRAGEFKWEVLPSWPGPARVLPVAAVQGGPGRERFFLFSGRVPEAGRATRLLRDAYAFDPRARAWSPLANVGGGAGVCVMAGTAVAGRADEVLVFGGDRGELFLELEAHDLAVEAARAKLAAAPVAGRPSFEGEIERRLAVKRKIYESHPGFGREVYAYDTGRDTWRVAGRSPVAPQVTTLAVPWDGAIVIPSGEIRPGVRTPEIVRVHTTKED